MEWQNRGQFLSHNMIVYRIELVDEQFCVFCFSMLAGNGADNDTHGAINLT